MQLSKAYGLFHNKAKHISLLEQFIVLDRDLCSNKLADMRQFVDNRIKDVLYSCLSVGGSLCSQKATPSSRSCYRL